MSGTLKFDDYKSAFLNWLKDDTGLADEEGMAQVIVTSRLPDDKGEPPAHLLTARRVPGAVGQDNYPDHRPLLDVYAYGSTPVEAQRLAALVIARCAALPPARSGFRKQGVVCTSISVVTGMVDVPAAYTKWPLCQFSVRLTINPGVTA